MTIRLKSRFPLTGSYQEKWDSVLEEASNDLMDILMDFHREEKTKTEKDLQELEIILKEEQKVAYDRLQIKLQRKEDVANLKGDQVTRNHD